MALDILRHCRFYVPCPGREDAYVLFSLKMWDTHHTDSRGQTVIGYRLTSHGKGIIFEGEDFAGSPMHADDSDTTVRSLMNFLCLKLGDTDADYFAAYSASQMAFVNTYAEQLAMVVSERFGAL
jgi:hypothetical protein